MVFSFSHLPSRITFILGLFITCAFCELTSETSLVAPFLFRLFNFLQNRIVHEVFPENKRLGAGLYFPVHFLAPSLLFLQADLFPEEEGEKGQSRREPGLDSLWIMLALPLQGSECSHAFWDILLTRTS